MMGLSIELPRSRGPGKKFHSFLLGSKVKAKGKIKMARLQGRELPVAIGSATGSRLKRRVADQARPVEREHPYGTGGRFYVNKFYTDKGKDTRTGRSKRFDGSSGFHRAMSTRHGSNKVSGGGWKGFSVGPGRKNVAWLAFRGKSLGYEPIIGTEAQKEAIKGFEGSTPKGQLRQQLKPRRRKINNSLKMLATFADSRGRPRGRHILRISAREREALWAALARMLTKDADDLFGDAEWSRINIAGDPKLYADVDRLTSRLRRLTATAKKVK